MAMARPPDMLSCQRMITSALTGAMGGSDNSPDLARDTLTGLPVMEEARTRLRAWLGAAAGMDEAPQVHAALLGLRRFDTINLAYGESAGDGALVEVSRRLNRFLEDEIDGEWVLARGGGGHFLIIARGPCSRERWQWLAEELADAITQQINASEGVLRLSPRIALLRVLASERVDTMLDRLGISLAELQREQNRRVQWADGEEALLGRSGAQLEADLLRAIDRDEIEIMFQPQFSLEDNSLVGAEALARWQHGKLGRIGASALFTIAERADHVTPLSRHIAMRALELASEWPAHLRLSLNVTPADLADNRFAAQMLTVLRQTAFPPQRLTIEVTEHALLGDLTVAQRSLEQLSDEKIEIACDDFGAGFCNFRYLKVLPIGAIKLDRSMVEGVLDDSRDLEVLRAIVALGKALNMKLIAEGVEVEELRVLLAEEGCDTYQGYLGGEPMSARKFLELAQP